MFKTLNSQTQAISLDKKNKQVEGFLLDVKHGSKKFKDSRIYGLSVKGQRVEVWGCAAINGCLLIDGETLNPDYRLRFVRFTFDGLKKIAGRKEPMRLVTVQIDDSRKLALKSYKSKN